jgi:hypothetical protein
MAAMKFFANLILIAALGLGGCAPKAVGVVHDTYNFGKIKRVAMVGFSDYPGAAGSGEITASAFEMHLLKMGYSVVERRQINKVLSEQALDLTGSIDQATLRKLGKLLGVQAIVLGSVTDFFNVRDRTIYINMPKQETRPVYGEVITIKQQPGHTVKTVQNIVTGYEYSVKDRIVPTVETLPAYVGLSVRLVDVQTGQVVWAASASGGASDMTRAAGKVSSSIIASVNKELKRR